MQIVFNKSFVLNPEKKLAQIRFIVFDKNAKAALYFRKSDVTEPKARLLLI